MTTTTCVVDEGESRYHLVSQSALRGGCACVCLEMLASSLDTISRSFHRDFPDLIMNEEVCNARNSRCPGEFKCIKRSCDVRGTSRVHVCVERLRLLPFDIQAVTELV
jgi:hypothetical protein